MLYYDVLKPPESATWEVMRDHVTNVLGQYEGELKATHSVPARHAMMIAVVLENVARVIAFNVLSDPGLTPQLASKLLELYRSEIKKKLKGMDQQEKALKLAGVLVSDDPLALYMHDELKKEVAAERIVDMAARAYSPLTADKAVKMFDLVRQRFEIEMAPLARAGVRAREAPAGSYSLRETTGLVSEDYFNRLFGAGTAQPGWEGTGPNRRLTFKPGFQGKLANLRVAVQAEATRRVSAGLAAAAPNVPTGIPGVTLTSKQAGHLAEVAHQTAALPNRDAAVAHQLAANYGITDAEAGNMLAAVRANLATIPITIGTWIRGWFGKGQPASTLYRPKAGRQKTTTYAKLFDKWSAKGSIKYLGQLPGGMEGEQHRGEDYPRFRYWKDMIQTGKLGFSDEELPKYGSVNINWEARGTGQKPKSGGGFRTGVGGYGDTYFVLKKANLAGRLVYTATDYGLPRTDIYQAFCDLVLGGPGIVPSHDVEHKKTVNHIVNSVLSKQAVFAQHQMFEVQIFGQLDIARDVQAIYVAPEVEEKIYKRVRKFCQDPAHPIHCERSVPPKAIQPESWFANIHAPGGFLDQVQAALAPAPGPGGVT